MTLPKRTTVSSGRTVIGFRPSSGPDAPLPSLQVMEDFWMVVASFKPEAVDEGGWPVFERTDGSPICINPAHVETIFPLVGCER